MLAKILPGKKHGQKAGAMPDEKKLTEETIESEKMLFDIILKLVDTTDKTILDLDSKLNQIFIFYATTMGILIGVVNKDYLTFIFTEAADYTIVFAVFALCFIATLALLINGLWPRKFVELPDLAWMEKLSDYLKDHPKYTLAELVTHDLEITKKCIFKAIHASERAADLKGFCYKAALVTIVLSLVAFFTSLVMYYVP